MKKILREDLQDQLIGRFKTDGVWVECARDPETRNLVAVAIEYSSNLGEESGIPEKVSDLSRWFKNGYSVEGEAIRSKHFQLFLKQVFRAGKWDGKNLTEEDVQDIVNNQSILSGYGRSKIPIMLDHGDASKEKVGYIEGLHANGAYLVPDAFILKDALTIENVLIGLWDTISPYIVKNFQLETGNDPVLFKSWILFEVSIVVHPRDYQLSIRFSSTDKKEVKMDPVLKDKDKKKGNPEKDEQNKDNATKFSAGKTDPGTDPGKAKGSNAEGGDDNSLSMAAKLKTLEEENERLKNENLKMSNDTNDLRKSVEQLEKVALETKAEEVVKSLEMSGNLAPAQHQKWVDHYLKMSDDMRSSWVDLMKDSPKVIEFGRKLPTEQEQNDLSARIKKVHSRCYGTGEEGGN